MSALYQPVLDKIEELGPSAAAKYFGKSNPTIHAWRKKPDTIPTGAIQKVMDDRPKVDMERERIKEIPAPEIQAPAGETGPLTDYPDDVQLNPKEVLKRLDKLEAFARMMTDPDRNQVSSLLRPATPPQRTDQPAQAIAPAMPLEQFQSESANDANSPSMGNINRPMKKA